MLRVAALIVLVGAVAGLSRLHGHATPPAAGSLPLPRAATVVHRGMSIAEVRRLAGRPEDVRGLRLPCVIYATDESIHRRMETIVCFDKRGRVSTVHTGLEPHSSPPPAF